MVELLIINLSNIRFLHLIAKIDKEFASYKKYIRL